MTSVGIPPGVFVRLSYCMEEGYMQRYGMVFHGSPTGGLTVIEPKLSSHGEKWVYAAKTRGTALVFLKGWNDFIFNLAYGDEGVLELTERYPGAFDEVFADGKGYIYTLDGSAFTENATGFEGEVVSTEPAKVLYSEYCPDARAALLDEERSGRLKIRRWPDRHPDIPKDDSDLVDEALIIAREDAGIIEYCCRLHPDLRERFK